MAEWRLIEAIQWLIQFIKCKRLSEKEGEVCWFFNKTSDFFSVENYCLLISIENFILSPFGVYIACTEKGIQQERLESRNYSHQSAIYLEHA